MIRSGDEGQGQGPFDIKLLVSSNFRGDVVIVRQGEQKSWLDLSPDVAVALAYAILEKAGKQKVATMDGRLLELSR